MSSQFNYFAIGNDHRLVSAAILRAFGPCYWFPNRGPASVFVPRLATSEEHLLPPLLPPIAMLAPLALLSDNPMPDHPDVHTIALLGVPALRLQTISPVLCRLDARSNPIVEFSPAQDDGLGIATVGRLWSPHPSRGPLGIRFARLQRTLRSQSQPDDLDQRFRSFPTAVANARKLIYHTGTCIDRTPPSPMPPGQ